MDLSIDRPIVALASPAGAAARGIVRISGFAVSDLLADWFQPDDAKAWMSSTSARIHSGQLRLNHDGNSVTVAIQAMYWPNRRSYTGQPLIELHLPGSPPLLEAVLSEVYRRGARPARPGEFTLRSFLAGKVDLLQAEAVLGVIDAQDHKELETALTQLAGGLSSRLSELRRDLLDLLADLEAGLDFVEEDIQFVDRLDVIDRLARAKAVVEELDRQSSNRMQSRVRPRVILAGLPNAGKSTLFNRLAGTNAALVSTQEGTTRDFLVRQVNWNGLSLDLIDTAGWDDAASGIDAAAQRQRQAQLSQADILVWCSAANLNDIQRNLDRKLFREIRDCVPASIRLITKNDLHQIQNDDADFAPTIALSTHRNTGFAELELLLRNMLGSNTEGGSLWLGMTAARCRETLTSVAESLERAMTAAQASDVGDELISVDLRQTLDNLGVILGTIYTDDILDRVFSKFCIGK